MIIDDIKFMAMAFHGQHHRKRSKMVTLAMHGSQARAASTRKACSRCRSRLNSLDFALRRSAAGVCRGAAERNTGVEAPRQGI